MFRTYIPNEDGVLVRFGRTWKTLACAVRYATRISEFYPWVEVQDDSKPIVSRLRAVVRDGIPMTV